MEFQSDIAGVATAFAGVHSKAASARNLARLKTAEGNIAAAQGQIDLQESAQRRAIARSLAQFQGSQAAGRAHRGGDGGGSGSAIANAAFAQASDQVALVEANAAAREIAVIAANQVEFEDPLLAALEGGLQGLSIGTSIAQALMAEAEVVTRRGSYQLATTGPFNASAPPTFKNTITSILEIPGLDLGDFMDLSSIFDF